MPLSSVWKRASNSAYGKTTKASLPSGPLMIWKSIRVFIAFPHFLNADDAGGATKVEQHAQFAGDGH